MKSQIITVFAAMITSTFTGAALGADDTRWQYSLSPYAWFAGSSGEVSSISGQPAVAFDLSPKEAFDDNEASATLIFQGKKGKHGFLVDLLYSDTQSEEDVVPAIDLALKATSKNTVLSASYVHEVHNNSGTVVDVFGGLRYWDIDSTLEFEGGLGLLTGQKIKNTEDWIDPVGGVKAMHVFAKSKLYIQGWLAVGGFGVGSDSFYDTSVNLGYQWNEAIGTTIGYRLFDVDYDDNDFVYDAKNEGVALGLTWKF